MSVLDESGVATPAARHGSSERQVLLNFRASLAASLKIYPNPTARSIAVEVPVATPFSVRLVDGEGRLLSERRELQGKRLDWDLGQLAPGTYILEVDQGGYRWTRPVVINTVQP